MLPAKFVERVLRELGPDEGGALCRALTGEPSVSVRLNAAKGLAAPSGCPIGWSTGGYWLDARPSFTLDPDFHAGRYYVQEASSQFVGHIVAACGGIGGGRVLDLCAAPGGKTTLYSTLAGRGGLVVANEIVRNRAAVLADNVRKWGVGNVAVTVNDPSQVARLEGWFDAVAVDAPCSGEGMFRKEEAAVTDWSEETVEMCARRQQEILHSAAQMLRGGGRLVYSTCTFSPQENEGAVSAFLHAHPEFYVEEVSAPWFAPGRPNWVEDPAPGLEYTFRLWPHHLRGEGHYAAVLRKRGEDVSEQPEEKSGRFPPEFLEFQKASGAALPCGKPLLFGSTLYQMPEGTPELCGLKVLRAGLELGQLLRGRFEPAHAWALWLKDAKSVAGFPSDSEEIRRYLAGETISGAQTGWTLVRVDGLTLGWAKGSAGQLKNHYPKALRRG